MTHIINAILLLNLFALSSLAHSLAILLLCAELWRKKNAKKLFPNIYTHTYTQFFLFFCKNLYSEKLSKQKPKMFSTFAVHRHEVRERERTSEYNASKTWNIQHKVCRLLACLVIFIRYFRRLIVRSSLREGESEELLEQIMNIS